MSNQDEEENRMSAEEISDLVEFLRSKAEAEKDQTFTTSLSKKVLDEMFEDAIKREEGEK